MIVNNLKDFCILKQGKIRKLTNNSFLKNFEKKYYLNKGFKQYFLKRIIYKATLLPFLKVRMRNLLYLSKSSGEDLYHFIRDDIFVTSGLRSFCIIFLFLITSVNSVAPKRDFFTIIDRDPINPFESLMLAIGMVETMGNTMAYNEFEGAAGIFQIRQVKVDEFNRQTKNNYQLSDMFDYENSRKVFLHFASQIGPYNFEKIAKAWNGSGPMTEFYWKRIKSYLKRIDPN